MPNLVRGCHAILVLAVFSASIAQDGQSGFDGPPVPVAPDVVTRDDSGRATVRASRLREPLRVDGRLDDPIYARTPSISGFNQQEPVENAPATEKTEAWIFFDDDSLYISFRLWESRPDALVANEMRRDSNNIFQNDHIAFLLDTFHDRRNSNEFAIKAIGGRWDGQITNERTFNADWNPVWDLAVGRFEQGWTVEAAIPFKSLRYQPGRDQVWGLQRPAREPGQERDLVSEAHSEVHGADGPLPRLAGREPGRSRSAARVQEPGDRARAVSSLTSDLAATPRLSNDVSRDAGVDVKYGVSQNLTADFTYNTDFAQVEADEQQVNLTRRRTGRDAG